VLNRKLAGRPLPEGSRIISACNDGDEYQLTDLDPALVSRFNIYTFRPSADEWLLWAESAGLDKRIIQFISANPEMLDRSSDTKEEQGLEKDPDRRAWEKVAHDLAHLGGLNVPESKLEKFSKSGSTFLVKRFDRDGARRIHFSSALTMLGKTDGAGAGDGTGYLDMVSFIKSNGASPKEDLVELWRRIVFNMAVSNTDDHLRNHGFLLGKNGWRLSPLYDVNPVEEGNELALNVSETDNRISIDLAIETAHFYGIKEADAKRMAEEILSTVRDNWERLAKQYGLSRTDIEDKRPAFEICYRH
jgi:hypothetical protein